MYAKIISDGYIRAVVRGVTPGNITEAEYESILQAFGNKPETAEEGCELMLRDSDLVWVSVPIIVEEEEEETNGDS